MGLDLRLLPAYTTKGEIALTILECQREGGFFRLVTEFQKEHGKYGEIRSYHSEDAWVDYTSDAYGDDLQYILAGDLEKVFRASEYNTNRAIRAYLEAINPKTRVFLYWHQMIISEQL